MTYRNTMMMGIGGLVALLVIAGVITLIAMSFRKSRSAGVGAIFALFLVLGLFTALTIPALTLRAPSPSAAVTVSADPSPVPMPEALATTRPAPGGSYTAPVDITSRTVTYGESPTRRSSRWPNMVLAGLSLAALVSLARVAVDGRKGVGFAMPTRIIAALAFAGLCVILAKLGPIL